MKRRAAKTVTDSGRCGALDGVAAAVSATGTRTKGAYLVRHLRNHHRAASSHRATRWVGAYAWAWHFDGGERYVDCVDGRCVMKEALESEDCC